jgi:lysozyme
MNNKLGSNVVLTDNQYGAMASFVFNMNRASFRNSNLLKRLNAGEDPG